MRKYLYFFFTIVFFSCEKTDTFTEEKSISTNEDFLKLVNKARSEGRKCGTQYFAATSPVTWNSDLEKAAYLHSKDMFENKYFSHVSKNGVEPSARILAQNYFFKSFAENIYAASGFSPTPEEIIIQWVNSPTHCANIMTPDFKDMGIGGYQNHWTQLFGSK
ncbi:CAP domain-containing protein [Lacihabitans sp. CCS-44]|jgi:uncharacterized protein YkwD|uniref:CAP domain-containing protein n=1 Tax=Lacihabitans sp. CCS-44 TaxID=2487331 RepID=UPI0020CD8010|nr:CAP domain-containing protein [Lacihabitans sp. CCS-44]MCP9753577.1 CAP domain-containing protein [Lacihabitans sp. CCS-44]